jgi:signal transduction histidine kinase
VKKNELTGLAHDLNNVFQTVAGVAAHLGHEPELAEAILRSVERGRHIVAGMRQQDASATPFETILANAASFVEDFRIASKGPAVSIESRMDPGIMLAGNWAWERVLINLFLNSLRAMPGGGIIRVEARYTGGGAEISVADEGTGIAPEMLDCLFEPHTSGNGSTGMGLSIVESIVQRNGGTVRARNLERGAEFIIHVPLEKTRAAVVAGAARAGLR